MTNTSPSPRGEIAPAIVLVGGICLKILEYAEHLDFLLSVRDEKLANLLQLYRDFGWWVVALVAAVWLYYEYNRHLKDESARGSIGSLVASVAFVSFLLGSFITVKATASLPAIIVGYGGDGSRQICSADIDTSRLDGFSEDYRLILLCGAVDSSLEPLEDTRIAVSSPFHINNGANAGLRNIEAPFGNLKEAWKKADDDPSIAKDKNRLIQFQMWHTVALIPKDVQSDSIKKASDVKRMGGRILTEPLGSYGSPMKILLPPLEPAKTDKGKKI